MVKNFADYAREYLGLQGPREYCWEEYESGLDHLDVESLSEFARYFFEAGQESVIKEKRN